MAHAARSPGAVLIARKLRSHQRKLLGLVTAIGAGETDARDILAAVTPGGGKSLLIAGAGLYHRYNAVLKRVSGNKSRAQMTLSELEVAIGWVERNRLSEHLHLLDGDPRYAWSARKRGEWRPPVGRVPSDRSAGGPERKMTAAAVAATD